jgi:hypothetical protein
MLSNEIKHQPSLTTLCNRSCEASALCRSALRIVSYETDNPNLCKTSTVLLAVLLANKKYPTRACRSQQLDIDCPNIYAPADRWIPCVGHMRACRWPWCRPNSDRRGAVYGGHQLGPAANGPCARLHKASRATSGNIVCGHSPT